MDAERVVEVAMRCGGTVTWARLRRELPRRAIERALAEGLLDRVGRGAYALPKSPDALRAAVALGGVASHESAARLWFMDTLGAQQTAHITVPRRSRATSTSTAWLHWADLDERDVRGRVTSPLRTVLDCARSLPFADALAVADSALRRELVDVDELACVVARSRASGIRAARRVAAAADARAANQFESALRAIVIEAGLTGFVPQLRIETPHLVARVDLGDAELQIALEADSFEWHGSRSALDRDCRRYDELVRGNWLVLRFSWEAVMFDRPWVAGVITDTAVLRRRGHRRGQLCTPGHRSV
jgi:very-short-patch-repair endonuclease